VQVRKRDARRKKEPSPQPMPCDADTKTGPGNSPRILFFIFEPGIQAHNQIVG
jgi:hypothetical protein